MTTDWTQALPRPLAFVMSGGASFGAVQVGMLHALADAGIEPDLVVGSSVGTLNGAVVADHRRLGPAVSLLDRVWRDLHRGDVLPGGMLRQVYTVVRHGHLHANTGIARLVDQSLRSVDFDELQRKFVAVAASALTHHVERFHEGELEPVLLAATAIPGVFPHVTIDGTPFNDAGPIANVPLRAALDHGAASLVVLDAGDTCHLDEPLRGIPDALLAASQTAMRQRAIVEAPVVAEEVPLLYLPRPCVDSQTILDFDRSGDLIDPTTAVVEDFLTTADAPEPGTMVGAPHHHQDE